MTLASELAAVFDTLENEAVQQALDDIPIIADDVTSLVDSLDFDDLETAISAAVAAAEALTDAEARATALAAALNGLDGITASATGTDVGVTLTAGTDANVELLGADVGLGGSAFSLDAEADFTGSIGVMIDINFNYDTDTDTLTLVDTPQDEVSVSAGISADINGSASIANGIIGASLTDTLATPEINFTAGFNFASLSPGDVTFSYGGTTALQMDLATVVADNLLPGIVATLDIAWDPLSPTDVPTITFSEVGISVGDLLSQITEMLDPVTDILFEGIIGDIVNILTEPLPIINDGLNAVGLINLFDTIPESGDGIFNLLDGLGIYFEATNNDQAVEVLSAFAKALAILKQLSDFAENNDVIPLGDISIAGGDPDGPPLGLPDFQIADIGGQTPLEFLNDLAGTANLFEQVLESVPGLSEAGIEALSTASNTDESGLSFPLFENPARILDILLPEITGGGPVPIIQYDIPAISSEARFGEYFFSIFGPFGLTIDGFAEASVDFIVGYDTFALTPEGQAAGALGFVDGLFITTQEMMPGEQIERQPEDLQFEFRPIAYSSAGVFAGVAVDAVVLRVGVSGGIVGFVAAFLPGGEVDTDAGEVPNGVLRLSDFGSGCFLDPILGRIGAEVIASIRVGFGIFSFEYDVTIADITIANFEFGCPPAVDEIEGLGRFAGDAVLLHVGPEIGNRIIDGQPDTDVNETYRISEAVDEDGNPVPGALRVEYAGFFQNFGVEDGEPLPTEITADFGEGDDALVISADLDVTVNVSGGSGNDILEGAALDDTLSGGDNDDRLFGRAGNDTLIGGDGNDYLEGGLGADTLNGGDGRDRVSYEQSAVGVSLSWDGVNIRGQFGEAEGDVLSSIEYLVGSAFNDVLTANPAQDSTLQGNSGDDVLLGGVGDDFLLGDAGADYMDGGAGDDGTSYVTSSGAVQIDLASGVASGGDAEGDLLVSIESVMGSAFYDVLSGTGGANIISGWVGDDILDGRRGADEILGDVGDDTVYAYGDGAALLDGGAGHDLISFERATSAVTVDLAAGTASTTGTDTIGFEQTENAAGDLVDTTKSSFEDIDGSAFFDTLTGDVQANLIRGLDGDDTIDGGQGNDTLIGGAGADALDGGAGTDWADYTDGFGVGAQLSAGIGFGSTATGDTLTNIENLRGSDGADFLIGDGEDNIIAPGLSAGAEEFVDGAGGEDTLWLDYSRQDWGLGVTGGLSTGRFERLAFDGTTRLDGVQFQNIENFWVTGTFRDDEVETGLGDDRLYLGGGDDTVDSGSGFDIVLAQEGDDTVTYESADGTPLFVLSGGDGFDGVSLTLAQTNEDIVIRAGDGERINLILSSGASVTEFENLDFVRTGEGADTITQFGISDNLLFGGGSSDIINPGRGIDFVNGGDDITTDALQLDVADRPVFVVTEATQLLDIAADGGDRLVLDWSDVTSAISSDVDCFLSATILFEDNQNVVLPLMSHQGTYETADGLDRTDFTNIESVDITGGSADDELIGTWAGLEADFSVGDSGSISFVLPSERGNDRLAGSAGNDTLIGLTGSDELFGGDGNDRLIGSDLDIILGQSSGKPFDAYEIDTLTGGAGADRFVLGGLTNNVFPEPQTLYLGRVGADDDTTDSRAIITDFDASEGDRLELAGPASGYRVELTDAGVNILVAGDDRNIIAFLEGVEDFTLDTTTSVFLTGGFGPGFEFPILPILPVPIFDDLIIASDPDLAFSFAEMPSLDRDDSGVVPLFSASASVPGEASFDQAFALSAVEAASEGRLQAALPVPAAGVLEAPLAAPLQATLRAPSQAPTEAPSQATTEALTLDAEVDDPWVVQANLPSVLSDVLLEGVTGEIAAGTLTLEGDGRAFGIFDGDPFGLGQGIVVSTGIAEELDGQNEIDGGLFGPFAPELEFESIGEFGGSGIFRADLSFVGTVLNSITIADDNDAVGGGVQGFSGLDLDALILSRQLVTDAEIAGGFDFNDPAQFERLDVFNYASAFSQFTPGSIRSGFGPAVADTFGTENGIIDLNFATLDTIDFDSGQGFATLGDGGVVGFDLTETVDTDGPLYLYVAEGAANEELEANITASDARLAAPADLSTDFGAEGSDGDLIRLTYTFDLTEDAGKLMTFDFAFVTEELREFAGTEFNDALRITLNGVQLAELSDGTALTVNQLLPAPFAASHPDLLFNTVEDGAIRHETRVDAYTTPLSFIGATQAGQNTLVIEVEDVRDGLMDSAVLIRSGSLDIVDGGGGGVIDLPPGMQGEPIGVDISSRVLSVTEGAPPVIIDLALTGVLALTEDVVLTLTPGSVDIDLGGGAGAAVDLTFSAGGSLSQSLAVSAPLDGLVEPTEIVLASISVDGAAAFAGLPVAPLVVTVLDTEVPEPEPEPFEITLGGAPDRFFRSAPDAWSDAWTVEGIEIQQSADATADAWAAINLSTLDPGTFGGSSLFAGDLGVSGRTDPGSLGRPQQIDGTEGLRFLLDEGLSGTALAGQFAGFEAGEAARIQTFDDGALVDTFFFDAVEGDAFDIDGLEGFDEMVITAGALNEAGDNFVFGALDDGLAPAGDDTSRFRLEDLTLAGFDENVL